MLPRRRSGQRQLQAAMLGAGDRRSSKEVRMHAAHAAFLRGLHAAAEVD